ncbi:MAG: diguanylate cyclase, partial [Chloroflexi bacterium]|nr:diguanylate cyclase [Chloroflexota bacterium]
MLLAIASYLDVSQVHVAAAGLLGLSAAVGVWQPLRRAGLLAGFAGSAVLGFAAYSAAESAHLPPIVLLPAWVASCAAVMCAGILGDLLAASLGRDEQRRAHDQRLIQELTPTIGATETSKWEHALRMLRDEVDRARRYGHPVAVALIGVNDWPRYVEEHGAADAELRQISLAAGFDEQLRPSDLVALHGPGELAIIMPHTPLQGALVAIDKLR